MADKTIGTLPAAESLDDESLLVAEQQSEAVSVSGALLKQYAAAAATSEADRAEEAADRAEAAVAHNPTVGENGNWFVWDAESGSYVDSGHAATGAEVFVTSFNGRTGAILPRSGDYTAEMVGAAPAGFGLGVVAEKTLKTMAEVDAFKVGGKAYVDFSGTEYRIEGQAFGILECAATTRFFKQTFSYYYAPHGGLIQLERIFYIYGSGTWEAWEFVNPPMILGVEYRTTERHNSKPVYTAAFSVTIPDSYTSGTVIYPTLSNGRAIKAVDLLDAALLGVPTTNGQRRFVPMTGEPFYSPEHSMTEVVQVFSSVGTTSAGGNVGLRYFYGSGISPHGQTLIGSVKYTKE